MHGNGSLPQREVTLQNHLHMCFFGFHQNRFFAFGFCQILSFSKKKVSGNDSKPKKDLNDPWNLFYQENHSKKKLNDSKVFEYPTTYRIIYNFLFTSVSLNIFLATLNLAKTNAWKWFLTRMRSHQPMESFRASHFNDSMGILTYSKASRIICTCVFGFSSKLFFCIRFLSIFKLFKEKGFWK